MERKDHDSQEDELVLGTEGSITDARQRSPECLEDLPSAHPALYSDLLTTDPTPRSTGGELSPLEHLSISGRFPSQQDTSIFPISCKTTDEILAELAEDEEGIQKLKEVDDLNRFAKSLAGESGQGIGDSGLSKVNPEPSFPPQKLNLNDKLSPHAEQPEQDPQQEIYELNRALYDLHEERRALLSQISTENYYLNQPSPIDEDGHVMIRNENFEPIQRYNDSLAQVEVMIRRKQAEKNHFQQILAYQNSAFGRLRAALQRFINKFIHRENVRS